MSTDLSARAPSEALVTQDFKSQWGSRQIALIARTVAKDASPEELHFFLTVAGRYNLDPFQGEIYCSKMRGKNGGEGRIAIIVGEQGRLKIANRYPDYRGFRSDVVCANDRFLKMGQPVELPGVPGMFTYVEHSYGHPNERGEIVGGWCEVYREGRPPTYFYAPLAEYMPDPENMSDAAKRMIPWFSTESRMIVKCAISTGFRMAFNLAGIYGEEEIEHIRKQESVGQAPNIEDEIEWGEDEQAQDRMKSLFAAANNCSPGAFPPAKIRLMLAGLTDAERGGVAAEVIKFIRAHGGQVPEPGEIVVDETEVEIQEPGEEPADEAEGEPAAEPVTGEPPEAESIPGV